MFSDDDKTVPDVVWLSVGIEREKSSDSFVFVMF
jgi:hypothetical protein